MIWKEGNKLVPALRMQVWMILMECFLRHLPLEQQQIVPSNPGLVILLQDLGIFSQKTEPGEIA